MRGFCINKKYKNMGLSAVEKCFITDLPVTNISSSWDVYEYSYKIGGKNRRINIPFDDEYNINKYSQDKKRILKGLLLNGIWHNEQYTTCEVLDKLIESNNSLIPKTPKEKKDKLLNFLYKRQQYDGETIQNVESNEVLSTGLFFRNELELLFYSDLLIDQHLIEAKFFMNGVIRQDILSYKILIKGIEYVLNLNEGEYSDNCFVAMSFTDEMFKIFDEAIRPAITETGFVPILISKEHLSSDTTINDGIIAAIKKSRFTISDFTDNKNGVYFEAGYALGRGQKVIYTCKETDLKNVHFDTKSYQHIVWKDAADLKKKLIDKIEAFIK